MASRTLLRLLGLALALVLLISSEVAARDLVETSTRMTTMNKATKMDGVNDVKLPRIPVIEGAPPIPRIPVIEGAPPILRVPSSIPLFGCPKGCCAQVDLGCLDCC
ncbi:uncharacterized protein LOC122663660 [Telopea speciosissima]|uniref:uncharacterized protein LOC122663660 n=1 Tax=Telopea speciosissima TaxID=54955 RepID=UPI001CC33C4E|nr:uncharacterized protein LOC122663660 [Telopea speciosissima]